MIVDLNLVVNFRHRVSNLRLVGLIRLHPTFLIDFVVSITMSSVRKRGTNILDMVRLGICSESAPL